MSCENRDKAEEIGIAYFRWGRANIGMIGCPEHLKEVFDVLREYQNKAYALAKLDGGKV